MHKSFHAFVGQININEASSRRICLVQFMVIQHCNRLQLRQRVIGFNDNLNKCGNLLKIINTKFCCIEVKYGTIIFTVRIRQHTKLLLHIRTRISNEHRCASKGVVLNGMIYEISIQSNGIILQRNMLT